MDSCTTSRSDAFHGCNRPSSGDWYGGFHACMKGSNGLGCPGAISCAVASERVERRGDGERRSARLGSDGCERAGVEVELVCEVRRSNAGQSHGNVNRSCA